ncbi:MAG: hypothetical protein AAB898_01035 [Patescibacteria group bacterium]
MMFVIGVPLVILLSIGFGFLMVKKTESILLGKIYGAFALLFLMMVLIALAFLLR